MLPKWTVLSIGAISRNKFWGESDDKSHRNIYCTSTLIQTDTDIIIVDPSMQAYEMAWLLDFRSGLTLDKVTKVYATHFHGDHSAAMPFFPNAQWFMPPLEIDRVEFSGYSKDRIIPARDEISPGINTIALPGHTPGLTGLWFDSAEGRVVVAGDGVMTRDFFRHRTGYYNSTDLQQAAASIDKLIDFADVIVPGHDNYFLVKAALSDPE